MLVKFTNRDRKREELSFSFWYFCNHNRLWNFIILSSSILVLRSKKICIETHLLTIKLKSINFLIGLLGFLLVDCTNIVESETVPILNVSSPRRQSFLHLFTPKLLSKEILLQ